MNNQKINFENCTTYGDEIHALFLRYCDSAINTFVLEEAIRKINVYRKKREELKNSFGEGIVHEIEGV